MPSRKGWLTPNAPIPSDTVCRRVLIPNDLQIIAAVNGALLELTKNYNWEQFGSASPEEIAAVMFAMYEEYVFEPCASGECRRIYRIGLFGLIERSDDGGETWESASDEIPPTPAREEATEEDRLCAAASNAVNVLHLTYEEMIDAWQLDNSVEFGIGAFAAILALLVGNWLGVVSAIAIPFVWELFGGVYATLGTFLQDAWDADFTNSLTCIFLDAASDDNGVVSFDWASISQGLADRVGKTYAPEDALLWAQLNYMILFIGAEGLNAAGATTGVMGDCDNCGDTWTYVLTPDSPYWYFSDLPYQRCGGNWIAPSGVNYGTVVDVSGVKRWQTTLRGSSASLQIAFNVPQPATTAITQVSYTWGKTVGALSNSIEKRTVLSNATHCNSTDCGSGACSGTTIALQGTDLVSGGWLNFVLTFLDGSLNRTFQVHSVQISGTGENPFL